MIYQGPDLELREDRVIDRIGTLMLSGIPDPQPECPVRLVGTTPILERLWRVALWDAECNIKDTGQGRYFTAGKKWATVITRDIAYAGVLGLNRIYPDVMRSSIEVTRQVRRDIGFKCSRGHAVAAIDAPWEEWDLSAPDFRDRFGSHGFTRRSDDVVWLWAADDLFRRSAATVADWEWLYATGTEFFERFYSRVFDPTDGLYRGQASFMDVSWPDKPRPVSGYPAHFKIEDCIAVKAASTNALYVKGLRVLREAARRLGRDDAAAEWARREEALKQAIRQHLLGPDGRIRYYKDRHGALAERAEALGTALCVLHDAVDSRTGALSIRNYPRTPVGIPSFDPFFDDNDRVYHNNATWPFVDTLFLAAAEKTLGTKHVAYNLALLARTVRDDGFNELVDARTGEVKGSGHQLWSAAAFIDACERAGISGETR